MTGTSLDATLEKLRGRRGIKWTHYGPDVLPAWVADMDYPVAPPVRQAILDTLDRNDLGYPGDACFEALAGAFAARMSARFGWQPDPTGVMPVGNLIQALIASVATFSEPGDGVVIQTPIYYPFLNIVAKFGRRLVENRLLPRPGRYEIDEAGLEQAVDDKTRLFLLCNPHNPSGRVLERGELERIAALAVERDLVVVSDEIHADLVYPGSTHIPLASLGPEIAARTITITSASKAFSIAGLKCAVIHFGSQKLKRQQTALFPDHLLGIPNIMGVEATLAAWRDGDEWLQAVLGQLQSNRATVSEFLAERLPGVVSCQPEASYLTWMDCEALDLPARPYNFFLSEAKVAFSDGRLFSGYTDNFVRLNFATTGDVLEQILERVAGAVEGFRQNRES